MDRQTLAVALLGRSAIPSLGRQEARGKKHVQTRASLTDAYMRQGGTYAFFAAYSTSEPEESGWVVLMILAIV